MIKPFQKINSLAHPSVKHAVKLRESKAYREEKQTLLISGKKMVQEANLCTLFTTDENCSFAAKTRYLVTKEILKKITALDSPDGFAAEVAMPISKDLQREKRLLILDHIQDPGNLGTLFRSALALGWDGIWITPDTVDPFNDKALRASKGAAIHMPFEQKTRQEIIEWAARFKADVFVADLRGTALQKQKSELPRALILSNESKGPVLWDIPRAKSVTIPMKTSVESLNVAAAGAIFLYMLVL